MKPIIGILGRAHKTNTDINIMCTTENYRIAVSKCGGIPILILPPQAVEYNDIRPSDTPKLTQEEILDLKRQVDLCDGIILPGGTRIYEYAYEVLDYIIEKDIPCLGTCLGMQTIVCGVNNRDSKKILSKIESEIEHRRLDKGLIHDVDILPNTKLYKILGKSKIKVNSKHSYCVNSKENLKVSAYSEDGIIEGIELENKKFIVGVQWHPEDLLNEDMEKLIKELIINSIK